MHALGFESADDVRVGKTITFTVEADDGADFRAELDKLCSSLLSNPVIEDYRYEIA